MCQKCNDLAKRISELEAANKVLRQLNTRMNSKNLSLKVENNNLRNIVGVRMQPISGAGYLPEWERQQEAGQ